MNTILDVSPHWARAHVGDLYYHVDEYAQRTIRICDHRVEFDKFFYRIAKNSDVGIIWLNRVRDAIAKSKFVESREVNYNDVLNEALFIACYRLGQQELQKEIMPEWTVLTTLGNHVDIEYRTLCMNARGVIGHS